MIGISRKDLVMMRYNPPSLLRETVYQDEYCSETRRRDPAEVIGCMEALLLSEIDALEGPMVQELRKHAMGFMAASMDEEAAAYKPYLELLHQLHDTFVAWRDRAES